MIRLLSSLALVALFAVSGFSTAADTIINCAVGGDGFTTKNTHATTVAAEKTVQIVVTPGYQVTVEYMDSQDWKYLSTPGDATTDKPILATQTYQLTYTETTTFSTTRTSADGVLYITPLKVERTKL